MSDELDDRYTTYREFSELHRSHAALEATVTNQLNNVVSALGDVKAMLMRPQVDHGALATHRAIETLPQTLSQALASTLGDMKQNQTHTSPFTIVLSYIGIAAIAAFGVYIFTHH